MQKNRKRNKEGQIRFKLQRQLPNCFSIPLMVEETKKSRFWMDWLKKIFRNFRQQGSSGLTEPWF
jgi:hypothetical protein